jgi:5-methylcytosine-specific restriction protein A
MARANVKLRTAGNRVRTADTRRVQPPAKTADPFYTSTAWLALMAHLKAQRGNRCEDPHCKAPYGPWSRLFGDHIIELRDGGAPLDKANVMLRCGSCHTRKTAEQRAKRLVAKPSV